MFTDNPDDASTLPDQPDVNTAQAKAPPGFILSRTHSNLEFYNKRTAKRRNFYEGVYNRKSQVFLKGNVMAKVKGLVVWLCLFFFSDEKLWIVIMNPENNEFLEQSVHDLESSGKELSSDDRVLWQKEFEAMLDVRKEKPKQRTKRKKNQDYKKNQVMMMMKKKTLLHRHLLKLLEATLIHNLFFHESLIMKLCL